MLFIKKLKFKIVRGKLTMTIHIIDQLSEDIGYMTNTCLLAVNCTKVEEGWRVMLRVRARSGKVMVSFTYGPTPTDCFELINAAIHTTALKLKWKDDKYDKG